MKHRLSKISITIEESLLDRIDFLVEYGLFKNRSQAFQYMIYIEVSSVERDLLKQQCYQLDKLEEQFLAEDESNSE